MGDKLTNQGEVLYRHIHPDFLDGDVPSSDRFRPSKKDKNMLSVDRSSIHDAATSHQIYTSTGRKSAAIFGVSVGEFNGKSIECIEDPVAAKDATDTEPAVPENKAHALADYAPHSEKDQKNIAKELKRLAMQRKKIFP
jgi:hypothetical protein